MENILIIKPKVFILKSKFFLFRVIGYFSFLFIPIYTQKYFISNPWLKFGMMLFYLSFLVGQWFLIGKEVDHRLRIFFKVNSNMDRVLYRTIMGLVIFIFYTNIVGLLPDKWINNMFWVTWALIGLFFSWPTRGKIIRESVTSNFTEFKFLDSFEKTTLGLVFLMVFFSVPGILKTTSITNLINFYDPGLKFSPMLWVFLKVSFFPFFNEFKVFPMAMGMHFYFIFQSLFLLTFYALLRFFFSRRLSILGVFALVSSWGFSLLLYKDPGASLSSTFPLIWIWSMLWVVRSSSYRTGLFLGLINCLGILIDPQYAMLILFQIPFFMWVFFRENTKWFRRQFLKYCSFGYGISMILLFFHNKIFSNHESGDVLKQFLFHLNKKAFLILTFLGILILIFRMIKVKRNVFREFYFDHQRFIEMLAFFLVFFLLNGFGKFSFSIICLMIFLSLIPLELLFQKTSRLRSSRNMIFLVYVLICLLDSRFEGRVKIFLKMFE